MVQIFFVTEDISRKHKNKNQTWKNTRNERETPSRLHSTNRRSINTTVHTEYGGRYTLTNGNNHDKRRANTNQVRRNYQYRKTNSTHTTHERKIIKRDIVNTNIHQVDRLQKMEQHILVEMQESVF